MWTDRGKSENMKLHTRTAPIIDKVRNMSSTLILFLQSIKQILDLCPNYSWCLYNHHQCVFILHSCPKISSLWDTSKQIHFWWILGYNLGYRTHWCPGFACLYKTLCSFLHVINDLCCHCNLLATVTKESTRSRTTTQTKVEEREVMTTFWRVNK